MALLGFGASEDTKPKRGRRPAPRRSEPTKKQHVEAQATITAGIGFANALCTWLGIYPRDPDNPQAFKYVDAEGAAVDPLDQEEQSLVAEAVYGVVATQPGAVLVLSQLGHFGGPYGELVRVAALLALPRLAVRNLIPAEMVTPLYMALVNLKQVAEGEYEPPAAADDTAAVDESVSVETGSDDVDHRGNGHGQIDGSFTTVDLEELHLDTPDGPGPENGVHGRPRSRQHKADARPEIQPDSVTAEDGAVVEVQPDAGA